jgi:hypothetical protein
MSFLGWAGFIFSFEFEPEPPRAVKALESDHFQKCRRVDNSSRNSGSLRVKGLLYIVSRAPTAIHKRPTRLKRKMQPDRICQTYAVV